MPNSQSPNQEQILRHRLERLEQVIRIGQVLNSTLNLEELLHLIAATATEVTTCEGCSILLLDPDTGQLRFEAAHGAKSEALKPIAVPTKGSIAGWVVQHRQPVLITNVQEDPRHYRAVDHALHFTTRSLLAVPLMMRDECIGVLEVVNKRDPEPLSEEDTYTLTALASQAAVAIENARLMGDLRQAHEELTRLDQMKSDFITIASHELRTPLALILGHASFLKETVPDSNREQMDILYQSALRLRELIDDMVNLRHIQTRAVDFRAVSTPVAPVVEETLAEFRELAVAKRLQVHLEVAPDVEGLSLEFDPPKIRLILANLLSNAIKFTPEGGTISVRVDKTPQAVHIVVADTGIGIPEDAIPHIFDQFYQAGPAITRQHDGLGLGLSIAKGLVELHGGRIWVESTPGQGSVFTFSLPLQPARPA